MKKIFMLLLLAANFAKAGEVGNGGDPLRLLVDEARKYTAEKIQSAQSCAFSVNTKPEVVSWIMEHKDALVADVLMSQHVWITDPQTTCAWTQPHAQAPITFSFETCRPGIKGINDAITLLTHESVHHFGVTDEFFADQVGRAVANIGMNCSCNPVPSIDPFNPASCPGTPLSRDGLLRMIPLPNNSEKNLGSVKAVSRMRTCYANNWCSNWGAPDEEALMIKKYNLTNNYPSQLSGVALVRLYTNEPTVTINIGSWNMNSSIIESYNLKGNVVHADTYYGLYTGDQQIGRDVKFSGWITNSCFRQTVKGTRNAKDNNSNDVVIEYETVLLSHFQ